MCTTCGCSADEGQEHRGQHVHAHDHGHAQDPAHDTHHRHGGSDHAHAHDHPHSHDHARDVRKESVVRLERAILEKNDRLAERNRGWLEARGVLALNVLSSPGAGKTTLLERTVRDARVLAKIAVIEGDQATSHDADRIRAAGARALQINTGTGCHLDAAMIARALPELDPPPRSIVVIENVGNLVCPALFDLGEDAKVIVASVTEGEDKPLKYPHMFRAGALVLLNKVDLLPHVRFDVDRFTDALRQVNPRAEVLRVSATQGEGLDRWYAWIDRRLDARRARSGEEVTL